MSETFCGLRDFLRFLKLFVAFCFIKSDFRQSCRCRRDILRASAARVPIGRRRICWAWITWTSVARPAFSPVPRRRITRPSAIRAITRPERLVPRAEGHGRIEGAHGRVVEAAQVDEAGGGGSSHRCRARGLRQSPADRAACSVPASDRSACASLRAARSRTASSGPQRRSPRRHTRNALAINQ